MVDYSKLQGVTGVLRIISLILGFLVLGLTAGGIHKVFAEIFFLAIVTIALISSIVILICFIVEVLPTNKYTQSVDSAYHGVAGIGLVIGSVMFLVLVLGTGDICSHFYAREDKSCPYGNFIVRLFGALLGVTNSVVYLLLSLFLYKVQEY